MTTCITIKTESVTVQNIVSVTARAHIDFGVLTITDRDGATTKLFFDDAAVAEAMARAYAPATMPDPEPQTLDVLLADEVAS